MISIFKAFAFFLSLTLLFIFTKYICEFFHFYCLLLYLIKSAFHLQYFYRHFCYFFNNVLLNSLHLTLEIRFSYIFIFHKFPFLFPVISLLYIYLICYFFNKLFQKKNWKYFQFFFWNPNSYSVSWPKYHSISLYHLYHIIFLTSQQNKANHYLLLNCTLKYLLPNSMAVYAIIVMIRLCWFIRQSQRSLHMVRQHT